MLTPIRKPLPPEIQEYGYRILEILHGLSIPHQLDLACRSVLAVLVACRPEPLAPPVERQAFTVLRKSVQGWLREEIAELRREKPRAAKTMTGKAKPRYRVGHA